MKTYTCVCKATLFFDNYQCAACQRAVGWCPTCRQIVALLPEKAGSAAPFQCGNAACGAPLRQCQNYAVEHVCNWCLEQRDDTPDNALCTSCLLTKTIPNLSNPDNRYRWARLERAKHRLLYDLQQLDVPYGDGTNAITPALRFHFVSDDPQAGGVATDAPVYTGHSHGEITINLAEVDDEKREQQRVALGEPKRNLLGHFRHEIGHYYYERLIQNRDDARYARIFGDPNATPYADAQQRYYAEGPAPDWPQRHVTAYASMHPWEDFAESFRCYLEMMALLDTARHHGLGEAPAPDAPLKKRLDFYAQYGVAQNELARALGMRDAVPENLAAPLRMKLGYIEEHLRQAAASSHR